MKTIMNKYLICICCLLATISCRQNNATEKWQMKRDNIIEVTDNVKYIDIGSIYISSAGRSYIVDDYLIITDNSNMDNLIHIFNKTTFEFIGSKISKGRGPGEIINIGDITYSYKAREVYISDKGKQIIYTYPIDSLINSNRYIPK